MKATSTYDLLSALIAQLDPTFTGIEISTVSTGVYMITTLNTKWLTKGYTVTIGAHDYEITDFVVNESITLSGTVEPTTAEFDIYLPHFSHGTVLEQNQLLNLLSSTQNSTRDRLPLIWLKERVRDKFEVDEMLRLDRESDCELYFLIDCNMEDWLREDFDVYTIEPMRNLIGEFIAILYNAPNVRSDFSFDITDDAKFGVYQDDKGNTKKIFNDSLSGSKLSITIPFLKQDCDDTPFHVPEIIRFSGIIDTGPPYSNSIVDIG